MAIKFVVPEVNPFPSSFSFTATLYFLQVYLLSVFSPFFPALLISKLQDLSEKIFLPTKQPHLQCLGPMGDPDPTDLINAETNRIPFRAKNFSLDLWKDTFQSWPKLTKGWKDWFQ